MRLPPRPGTERDQASANPPAPAPETVAEPRLYFGSIDGFARERLRFTSARMVGPQGPNRWSAE